MVAKASCLYITNFSGTPESIAVVTAWLQKERWLEELVLTNKSTNFCENNLYQNYNMGIHK